MPLSTSAKKALRKDIKKNLVNSRIRVKMRSSIKKLKQEPNSTFLAEVYSAVDRAAKKNIVHPNKAARIKSRLTKVVTASLQELDKEKMPATTKTKPKKVVAKKAVLKKTSKKLVTKPA